MYRDTSKEAYERIQAEGLLPKRRWEVYSVLYRHGKAGGMTAGEIFEAMRKESPLKDNAARNRNNVSTRLTELRNMRAVVEVGTRPCKVTGHTSIVWQTSNDVPTRLNGSKPALLDEQDRTHLRSLYGKATPDEKSAMIKMAGLVNKRAMRSCTIW